jgi:hypothetical protein
MAWHLRADSIIHINAPAATPASLRARSEIRRQSVGSRAVDRTPTLAWDLLVRLVGDEADLIERATAALEHAGDAELLSLVRKYADGWRPETYE